MTGAKGFSEVVGKPLRRKYEDIYGRTIKIRMVMVPCLRFQLFLLKDLVFFLRNVPFDTPYVISFFFERNRET